MFAKLGNIYSIQNVSTHQEWLDSGIYNLKRDSRTNQYYLERKEEDGFKLPYKIYGKQPKLIVDRVLKYFNYNNKSVGISLIGDKGSGKSLTAKMLCNESNLPVICIDTPYAGIDFNQFISDLGQPCVIYFDEFDKVYSDSNSDEAGIQANLLSLLDGNVSHQHIFIFTLNTSYNSYLSNRPTRIRYTVYYDNIEDDVINEVIEDMLIDKSKTEELLKVIDYITNLNMDMLIELINEINQFDMSPKEAISMMNIELEQSEYQVHIKYKDEILNTSKYFNEYVLYSSLDKNTKFEIWVHSWVYEDFDESSSKHQERMKEYEKITAIRNLISDGECSDTDYIANHRLVVDLHNLELKSVENDRKSKYAKLTNDITVLFVPVKKLYKLTF